MEDWMNGRPRKSEIRGAYQPGESPKIFNPLGTGNGGGGGGGGETLNHEGAHQELTRKTAFGQFSETLSLLSGSEKFEPLAQIASKHQWYTQEGCATYSELITLAESPSHFENALRKLPSSAFGASSPYREAFDAIAMVLPIEEEMSPSRLFALRHLALGIGRLSMDNDCLVQFLDPEKITPALFEHYLRTNSPDFRLNRLLNFLEGNPELQALIDSVEVAAAINFDPSRVAMGGILKLLPAFEAVNGLELRKQYARFRIAWQPILGAYLGDDQPDQHLDSFSTIPAVVKTGRLTLDLDDVRNICSTAEQLQHGLWVIIAINDDTKMLVDLVPYTLGENGNPISWDVAMKTATGNFISGEFEISDIVEVFDKFSNLPTAMTFMHGSWARWETFAKGHRAGQNSVKVCMARELSEVSFSVMLSFGEIIRNAKYFITAFDLSDHYEKPYAAFFVNPDKNGIYCIQYAPGTLGYNLVSDLSQRFGATRLREQDLQDLERTFPHLLLLQMMAMPALLP